MIGFSKLYIGCYFLIVMLLGGCSDKSKLDDASSAIKQGNYLKAAKIYQNLCDSGNGDGCSNLSGMYSYYYKDMAKSSQYAFKGCEMGSASGCFLSGLHYTMDENLDSAVKVYKRGCDMAVSNDQKLCCERYADVNMLLTYSQEKMMIYKRCRIAMIQVDQFIYAQNTYNSSSLPRSLVDNQLQALSTSLNLLENRMYFNACKNSGIYVFSSYPYDRD